MMYVLKPLYQGIILHLFLTSRHSFNISYGQPIVYSQIYCSYKLGVILAPNYRILEAELIIAEEIDTQHVTLRGGR